MKKYEISMLKILYLFIILWNVLAIVSYNLFSSFVEVILPFNAIALITLKFSDVIQNISLSYLRLRFAGKELANQEKTVQKILDRKYKKK